MSPTTMRRVGIALQGVVTGVLLWLALLGILVVEQGARIFRYQGF